MTHDAHQKVKASHLKRNAYLYVRQSTLRQVFENTESTQRQYALRHAAPTVAGQFQSDPLDFVAPINVGVFRRRRVLQASSQKIGFHGLPAYLAFQFGDPAFLRPHLVAIAGKGLDPRMQQRRGR